MDLYLHVKVLFGMIVGLSVAHLLKGVAGLVQHPKRFRVYWVHLVWVLFLFLYLIHFWWWEFNLVRVREWTFPLYFFVALYAVLLYLLCTLFFPEQIGEYDGFKGYYYSRRQWIFALMAALFVADIVDTLLKGRTYFHQLGFAYDIRTAVFLFLSLLAVWIKRPWFHAAFASFALLYEIAFILEMYRTIG
ncbi:MAG: hypothetical protein WBX22_02130 [Silvibacterium sp.]|jgi:hypothetical protein